MNLDLVAISQKINVQRAKQQFSINLYAKIWEEISEPHKRWLLRNIFLVEKPDIKPWGGYSLEEQHKIRTWALFIEEFSNHQQLIRKEALAKEKRVNAPD